MFVTFNININIGSMMMKAMETDKKGLSTIHKFLYLELTLYSQVSTDRDDERRSTAITRLVSKPEFNFYYEHNFK